MASEDEVRDALRWQAHYCALNAAPVTAAVCTALADGLDHGTATGRRALGWPGEPINDALPLRLAAPFHALFRAGRCAALEPLYQGRIDAAPAAVQAALAGHDAEICRWMDGPPQTNEPARSGVLMTGLLELAARFDADAPDLRFELLEIGSSAGLNLLIDRYRYDLGGVAVGPADSPVLIAPEWRGPPPPASDIRIAMVRGVDVAPIDVTAPGAVDRLLAYVWFDQKERFTRMEQALALAAAHPPPLERGDAADWVEARLAEPQADGICRVLMHSVVWQYLSPEGQARIEAAMARAGAAATAARPLGWVTYEADRSLKRHYLVARSWPGDGTPTRLGQAHPHGAWIDGGAR